MEAGSLPSIVEDVEADEELFSYKTDLSEKTEKFTGLLPKSVRTAGKLLYVTHDTTLYKVLSQGTQISDFLARYTLYQHSISKKRDPLTHTEAVIEASDAFVNYDSPSGRGLQLANDLGLIMFTKYYLRVQRAIQQAVADHPIRALTLAVADNYILGIQTILDSSLITGNGINFQWGAMEYWDALFQGAPMKMLGEVF